MLSIAERRKYILDSLDKQGFIKVVDMAEELNVTKATIRKDLKFLETKQFLYRAHGSAIPVTKQAPDMNVHVKSQINSEIKHKIGLRASKLICENDSIIVASGSTVYALAEVLEPIDHLNVVTPSIKVSMLLSGMEGITVLQLGGIIHSNSMSVRGEYASYGFDNLLCSKLFFGVDGIDPEYGVTCATVEEAALTKQMMKAASQTIVLTDSSKVSRRGFGRICSIGEIDILITDSGFPVSMREIFKDAGVNVIIV